MTGSKIIAGSQSSLTPNLVVVVSILLKISCNSGWGMCVRFVVERVSLFCAITDKWV